jgi:hypothetical protein
MIRKDLHKFVSLRHILGLYCNFHKHHLFLNNRPSIHKHLQIENKLNLLNMVVYKFLSLRHKFGFLDIVHMLPEFYKIHPCKNKILEHYRKFSLFHIEFVGLCSIEF